jgi:cystathionine beta-synthase
MNNPLVHELTTAPEIIEAVTSTPPSQVHPSSGKVDVFVAGAGTGGTVSGVARGIKKAHNSDCVVVGVDPVRQPCLLSFDICLNTRSVRLVPFSPSLPP